MPCQTPSRTEWEKLSPTLWGFAALRGVDRQTDADLVQTWLHGFFWIDTSSSADGSVQALLLPGPPLTHHLDRVFLGIFNHFPNLSFV